MRSTRGIATVLAVIAGLVMLVAGPVMIVKAMDGRTQVRHELTAQKIIFPANTAAGLPVSLSKYAGQQVKTGTQAKAYAAMIEEHVLTATNGKTFSEVSSAWIAGGRTDTALAATRQTAFMGESLRSSLMSAYQAWQVSFLVIGLGLLVTGLGVTFLAIGAALTPIRIKVPHSLEALRHHELVTSSKS